MAEDSLLGENKKIPISMKFQAHVGEKPALELEDALGNKCISIAAAPIAQAVKAPVSEDEIRKQLSKLGDTPYVAENIVIDAERGLFLPVSVLNTLRRDCAAQLVRAARKAAPGSHARTVPAHPGKRGQWLVVFRFSFTISNDFFPFRNVRFRKCYALIATSCGRITFL